MEEMKHFSPADMPQFRPDLANQTLNTAAVNSPCSETATAETISPVVTNQSELELIQSIRRALGGGNSDMILRQAKPGNGKSFRYI